MNGFNEEFKVAEGEKVGRIAKATHGHYTVFTENQTLEGRLAGSLYHIAEDPRELPAVGDWIVFIPYDNNEKALIQRVLTRRTLLSRKRAGETHGEQIIAANIDKVFIVTALTNEFNLKRIERYVLQVYESGALPVIICTKPDLCEEVNERLQKLELTAPGAPVYAVNNLTGEGIEEMKQELLPDETISFIGSSGVGKSTLLNRLMGEEIQLTQQVRVDDNRGRHTTTHRELFSLPNGTTVIDTPGMRELQLWGNEEAVDATFSDIEQLSLQCKFRDCKHRSEPGCAVKQAIEAGELDHERLKNYEKLKRELHRLALKEQYSTHRVNRMLHSPKAHKR
ncbi:MULTISPECIES: ribosome small subunit-dependent GTPase A [Pontibacillus]|uniref:Small ribosomal subunit biogenesis GTPase RsgA n=1 Tax=Pontibacillus chungwhensis TaxID=265426 RepID=A0ABY8UTS5_9BACI|nr:MULTISPECIES: ribosome small subunit-dependent GTPase A [Pontibacillus]MCD5323451.1 ribosome small subunit-dependent GTPase A [Pontibacillus sp. HN14]WIF96828.1 ribosome small subunit-dependent GTPase A [Pontibacillus chungwhensis]